MNLLVLPWIVFAIVSQPLNNARYVSDAPDTVTRYQYAAGYGLLAHTRPEWLALEVGDVIYADGKPFRVTGLYELTVVSVSTFRDENGRVLSVDEVDRRFFDDPNGLTLMTCLGSDGRLFVVAHLVDVPK